VRFLPYGTTAGASRKRLLLRRFDFLTRSRCPAGIALAVPRQNHFHGRRSAGILFPVPLTVEQFLTPIRYHHRNVNATEMVLCELTKIGKGRRSPPRMSRDCAASCTPPRGCGIINIPAVVTAAHLNGSILRARPAAGHTAARLNGSMPRGVPRRRENV